MKRLSFVAALTLSTMLSACGGGGGHGYIPSSTLPDNNPDKPVVSCTGLTCMGINNGVDTNGTETNAAKRKEFYDKALGTASAGIASVALFSARTAPLSDIPDMPEDEIDTAYNYMSQVLIDNPIDENDAESLRPYLILAGFEDLPETGDELKDWIANRKYMIKRHAEKAYAMYGTEKQIYLDNAKLHLVEETANQDTFINFTVDDKKAINGIEIAENDFGAEALTDKLNKTGDSTFAGNDKLHTYNYFYAGKNGPRLYIEISGYDGDKKPDLAFIKEKLQLKLRERVEENKITCDNGSGECNEMLSDDKWPDIAEKISHLTENDLENPDMFSPGVIDRKIVADYKSYAQKIGGIEGNNLLYSDFGLVNWNEKRENLHLPEDDENRTEERIATKVFAGGYDALKITPDKGQSMHFEGDAVAGVNYKQLNTKDEFQNSSTLELKGTAELDFNQGNETLTANFNNWYDVNVTKNLDGSNSIKFSNGNKEDFGVGIKGSADKNDFKFKGFDTDKFDKDLFQNAEYKSEGYDTYEHKDFIKEGWDPNSEGYTGAMDMGYYGKEGNISEATGYVMYHTETKNNPDAGSANDLIDVLEMQLGVGMQRK